MDDFGNTTARFDEIESNHTHSDGLVEESSAIKSDAGKISTNVSDFLDLKLVELSNVEQVRKIPKDRNTLKNDFETKYFHAASAQARSSHLDALARMTESKVEIFKSEMPILPIVNLKIKLDEEIAVSPTKNSLRVAEKKSKRTVARKKLKIKSVRSLQSGAKRNLSRTGPNFNISPTLIPESGSACPVCNKFFSQRANLITHIARVHENSKNFFCQICPGKSFVQKHDLNRHVSICHQKNFECEICFKKFGQKSVLNAHFKTVHQKIQNFGCSKCDLKFGTNSSYKRHFRAKHSLDISNFESPILENGTVKLEVDADSDGGAIVLENDIEIKNEFDTVELGRPN